MIRHSERSSLSAAKGAESRNLRLQWRERPGLEIPREWRRLSSYPQRQMEALGYAGRVPTRHLGASGVRDFCLHKTHLSCILRIIQNLNCYEGYCLDQVVLYPIGHHSLVIPPSAAWSSTVFLSSRPTRRLCGGFALQESLPLSVPFK
jgi:hypothetical protein